jgi:hypothetical protein
MKYSPKKTKKHIKKAVKNRKKGGGSNSLPHMSSTTSKRKKSTDARPTKYSPEGEWKIMQDGSSRRAVPASKRNKEQKPYKGW